MTRRERRLYSQRLGKKIHRGSKRERALTRFFRELEILKIMRGGIDPMLFSNEIGSIEDRRL